MSISWEYFLKMILVIISREGHLSYYFYVCEGTRHLISEDSIDLGRWSCIVIGKSIDFVEHFFSGDLFELMVHQVSGFLFEHVVFPCGID